MAENQPTPPTSQIAAALARSKGKKVEPVGSNASIIAEIHTSAPPMPATGTPPVPGKFTPKRIALASATVISLAVVTWLVWPAPPPPAPRKPVAIRAVPPPAAPPVAAPAPTPVETAAVPDTGWDPKLLAQIMKLPIAARRTGSEARIVVSKKVYEPGDTVIEGVILDAVLPDRTVFRDAQNHRFERRF